MLYTRTNSVPGVPFPTFIWLSQCSGSVSLPVTFIADVTVKLYKIGGRFWDWASQDVRWREPWLMSSTRRGKVDSR